MTHIKANRSEIDLLVEVLLKFGLDLCSPIQTRNIGGGRVHAIGEGILMICFADALARADAEELALGIVAWREALAPEGDTTCIFRDSAFADDVAKSNLTAILEQHGIANVRSI